MSDRLGADLQFALELDRLKSVIRRTRLTDGSRYENTAEHSWHLAMLALVLRHHADEPVDVDHVVRLVLCHDIVEIDASDTFIYDMAGAVTKAAREAEAADRLFGMIAGGDRLREYWREYEERATPEGRFAYALDRLQPMLQNHAAGGGSWSDNGIRADQVLGVNRPIAAGSVDLWEHAQGLVQDGIDHGWLHPCAGEPREDVVGPAPVLQTERLRLRWPRLADAPTVFDRWATDPEVTRYLTWTPHSQVDTVTTEFLRPALHRLGRGTEFTWMVEHQQDGLIGSISGRPHPDHGVEIGYALARSHWGQGFASEAARAVIDAFLGRDGVVRVWAYTDVANAASGRVLEKAGMVREGTLSRWGRCGAGEPVDCHVYAVTA